MRIINPGYRAIRAAAVKTLEVFVEAAHIAGVPFVLLDGTLLGCIRDHDFCPGDADDIDVGVMDDDWTKLAGLTEGLWFRVVDRWIYRENVENVKVQLCDNDVSMDIRRLHWHKVRDEVYNVGHVTIAQQRVYVANVYDGLHFRSPEDALFHGLPVRIPASARTLLEHRYGPHWETPVHRQVWDWPSNVPNACVRTDYDELAR